MTDAASVVPLSEPLLARTGTKALPVEASVVGVAALVIAVLEYALPRMAKAASHPDLQAACEEHLLGYGGQ